LAMMHSLTGEIAGVKRAYAAIFEPQPVQMPEPEGGAARRARLLPTDRR
jgi:hypothetical protein